MNMMTHKSDVCYINCVSFGGVFGNTGTNFVGAHSNYTTAKFCSKILLTILLYYIKYVFSSKDLTVKLSVSVLIWLYCFITNRSHLSHTVWPPWNFSLSSSLRIRLFKTIHKAVSSFWNKCPYVCGFFNVPHLSSYRANQEFSLIWDSVMPNFLQWISNSCIRFVHRTGNKFLYILKVSRSKPNVWLMIS